jgi:uncharacterized membrane protein
MLLKAYVIALTTFLLLDMLWLGVIAKNLYSEYLGPLMKPNINWVAAISFYLLFTLGLVIFVIQPALDKQSWVHAMLLGAFFGLVTYATYDLTNLATLKNWPLMITFIDLAWGSILTATVATVTYFGVTLSK